MNHLDQPASRFRTLINWRVLARPFNAKWSWDYQQNCIPSWSWLASCSWPRASASSFHDAAGLLCSHHCTASVICPLVSWLKVSFLMVSATWAGIPKRRKSLSHLTTSFSASSTSRSCPGPSRGAASEDFSIWTPFVPSSYRIITVTYKLVNNHYTYPKPNTTVFDLIFIVVLFSWLRFYMKWRNCINCSTAFQAQL